MFFCWVLIRCASWGDALFGHKSLARNVNAFRDGKAPEAFANQPLIQLTYRRDQAKWTIRLYEIIQSFWYSTLCYWVVHWICTGYINRILLEENTKSNTGGTTEHNISIKTKQMKKYHAMCGRCNIIKPSESGWSRPLDVRKVAEHYWRFDLENLTLYMCTCVWDEFSQNTSVADKLLQTNQIRFNIPNICFLEHMLPHIT